jgi:hypothetical protein
LRGQASLEALAALAALLAFWSILAAGVSGACSGYSGAALASLDSVRAHGAALLLDLNAADSRFSAVSEVDLRGCALSGDGVECGGARAGTLSGNSGGGLYGFFGSVPV